jgi:hypothetical protein
VRVFASAVLSVHTLENDLSDFVLLFERRLTRERECVDVDVDVDVDVGVDFCLCDLSMGRKVLDGRLVEFAPQVTNRAREVLLL